MSKISELSDGGALQSTDYLIAVRSGGNVKVQPAGMTFSSATFTTVDINGGTIDGAVIGGSTAAAGSFTTGQFDTSLNVDGTVTADGLSVGTSTQNETLVLGSSNSGSNFLQITNSTTTAANDRGFYVGIDANENARIIQRENAGMFFSTNNTEVMTLDASGNLLVGTTTPSAKLTLDNVANTTQTLISSTDSGGTGTHTHISFSNTNGQVGTINTSGSATAYNTSSDQRLKENIADAEDASNLVDAIKVRQFDWKADGSHQRYGMVAQELLEVAPEAVSGDPESDDMMGVDYSKLVPMLVKEIQSLRARVAQLEGA